MLTVAAYGGNAERAARTLKEQGISVTGRTLRRWRERTHAERYLELATEHGRAIENVATVRMREVMLQALSVQEQGLQAASVQLTKGEARDPSAVARNAAVVMGISTEKDLLLSGRPSSIVAHDSAEDILKRLQSKHPGMFVEGTAEEIRAPTATKEEVARQIERRRNPE